MKIINYEYRAENWHFNKVNFGAINLIVGDLGSGKTRLLNTIFNLGVNVANGTLGGISEWIITMSVGEHIYNWEISTIQKNEKTEIGAERLLLDENPIIERSEDVFVFNGATLPKLSKSEMSIFTLREEEVIKPIYDGFSKILRRRFFADELEKNSGLFVLSNSNIKKLSDDKSLHELYKSNLGVSAKLFILRDYFPEIYEKILAYYLEAFEFIDEVAIKDASEFEMGIPGFVPIFSIKEKSVDTWLRLNDLSSGMQKALLILTDVLSLPNGSIYLIDEYENSLGIGPINLLPSILFSEDLDLQVLVTSHHPYIISKFPVSNWYIAHRKGSNVSFAYGDDLVKKYSVSNQENYLQLLNDPIYNEGIE